MIFFLQIWLGWTQTWIRIRIRIQKNCRIRIKWMRIHSPALSEHVPFLVYIYYFGPVNFHYRYLCLNRCNFLVFWTTEFTVIMCERMQIFGILDQWIYSTGTYVWKYATFLYFGPLNLQYLCLNGCNFLVFWTSEFTVPLSDHMLFFCILDQWIYSTYGMSEWMHFFLDFGLDQWIHSTYVGPDSIFFVYWTSKFTVSFTASMSEWMQVFFGFWTSEFTVPV